MGLRATRAVVAHTLRMSDSSKLVTLVTERFGLVSLMAKGARRPRSKFGAALEPVTLIDCRYWHKDTREIQTISDVDIEDAYDGLKEDIRMLATASCMVEVSRSLTPPEDPTAGGFKLLTASLADLAGDDPRAADKHLWRFMLRQLAVSGYEPVLDRCIACGSPTRGKRAFLSFADGGVLCSCTEPGDRFGFTASPGTLMVMRDLSRAGPSDLGRIKLTAAQKNEVEETVLRFLAYHTGRSRPPRSLIFLRRLSHKQPPVDKEA